MREDKRSRRYKMKSKQRNQMKGITKINKRD